MFNQSNRHSGHKKFIIPVVVVLLIIGAFFALEPLALKQANKLGATANPEFKGHIEDIDISLLRGAVLLKNVTATLKKNDRKFFEVKELAVDLSWKELFKGSLLFDVMVNSFNLKVAKDIQEAVARLPKSEKKEAKQAFRVAHIDILDSKVTVLDLPGLGKDKHLEVKNIHGQVTDLTQRKNTKLGTYNMNATLTGKDSINLTGNVDLSAEKPRWDLDAKFLKFHLDSMNTALRKKIPLNYKKGTLDVYSEVKSENGKIFGYIKPFLNDVEFMGNKAEFKGPVHFIIEAIGAVGNWAFENDKRRNVATRIPFIYQDGAFSVEGGGAIMDAIQHGVTETDPVARGIENKYRLNKSNPAEVQAQEADLKEAKKEKRVEEKE